MAKLTKAAARRLITQAEKKFLKVYMEYRSDGVQNKDMMAIEAIANKCRNRLSK